MHVCICMSMHVSASSCRGRRQALDFLELEVEMVVSHPRWVLETELGSSVRVLLTLDCWTFFQPWNILHPKGTKKTDLDVETPCLYTQECHKNTKQEGIISVQRTLFLPPLLQGSLDPEGRDLMEETSRLRLNVPRSLILCCESLYLFPSNTGGNISNDSWARHWFMAISECH